MPPPCAKLIISESIDRVFIDEILELSKDYVGEVEVVLLGGERTYEKETGSDGKKALLGLTGEKKPGSVFISFEGEEEDAIVVDREGLEMMFDPELWEEDDGEEEGIDDQIHEIVKGRIFLSNLKTAQSNDGSYSILSLLSEKPTSIPLGEDREQLFISIADDLSENSLLKIIHEALTFIDNQLSAGRKTLVHCEAGRSRSASVIAAWILKEEIVSDLPDALEYIKASRPWIEPNTSFLAQLERYSEAAGKTYGQISFSPEFQKSILAGEKRATTRLTRSDADPSALGHSVGDFLEATCPEPFCVLLVTGVEKLVVDELTDEIAAVECLETKEDLKRVLLRFYPDMVGTDCVLVTHFAVVRKL
eukprot:TRINITY_DN31344_c0_g1_i1.p1 TRINITY_DN31344_c0_g1~~TRINITY_DN31344_c0_g1_i1.p1  ORF type:complete len:381 (+),score=82.72 TRINITY_DN31344_c0_g1_i1:55-1143(+)